LNIMAKAKNKNITERVLTVLIHIHTI